MHVKKWFPNIELYQNINIVYTMFHNLCAIIGDSLIINTMHMQL